MLSVDLHNFASCKFLNCCLKAAGHKFHWRVRLQKSAVHSFNFNTCDTWPNLCFVEVPDPHRPAAFHAEIYLKPSQMVLGLYPHGACSVTIPVHEPLDIETQIKVHEDWVHHHGPETISEATDMQQRLQMFTRGNVWGYKLLGPRATHEHTLSHVLVHLP